jgi:3-hydroxyisobutyrate dehydrogenase-like beta-hydroxyacid dehydrogenase
MANIGFLGLGNMGAPMAANLMRAGHGVRGFDLSPAAMAAAAAAGVACVGDAAQAARDAGVVITMLPSGRHVLDAYPALLAAARPDTLFIDARRSMCRVRAPPMPPRKRRAWCRLTRRSRVARVVPVPLR